MQALAGYTGWKFEYVKCDWSDCFDKLENGEIDIMGDISYTDERAQRCFSRMNRWGRKNISFMLIYRIRNIGMSDFKSLDGKRVGVLMYTEPEIMLTEWENKNGIHTEHVNVNNDDDVEKKCTTNGVITGMDGDFTLDVKSGDILQISYIGYKTQEIPVKNQREFNILLKEDSEVLEDVVVVGYGTQKKANLTGSVAQVDSKTLESRPIQNLSTGIQGLMPGVTVTSGGGAPGQDNGTIRVRGVGTLNSADPYILVDGIETSTMNEIDPNDVESISVLKDAASAAIYGSKASNGVILITTKRGKTGKPRISYNGYVGIQSPAKLIERMGSYDYARLYSKAMEEEGMTPRFDATEIQKFKDGTDPDYPNTDWYDEVYQTGVQHSHNVSVSGGTEDVKYMGSISYLHQTGILPNAMRRQFSGRTNLDVKLTSRLSARMNMAYINNDYSDPTDSYTGGGSYQIINLASKMAPWIVGRYPDGTYGTISDGSPLAWLDADQTVDRKKSELYRFIVIRLSNYRWIKGHLNRFIRQRFTTLPRIQKRNPIQRKQEIQSEPVR